MDQGAIVAVYLKEGRSPDDTYEALKEKAQELTVYLRQDIPASFNYSKSPDSPDILLVANPGNISNFFFFLSFWGFFFNIFGFCAIWGVTLAELISLLYLDFFFEK